MSLQQPVRCLSFVLAFSCAAGCTSRANPPSTGAPGTGGNASNGGSPTGGNAATGGGDAATDGAVATTGTDGGATTAADLGPAAPAPKHHRCAWMNDDIALGKASLAANADFFDAVHPYWWSLASSSGTLSPTRWADDATVVAIAHQHAMKLMPLVYGGNNVAVIRAVIGSAASISAHVSALAQLAAAHGYDGIELDYEHLWSAGDRAGYTALVTQLASALHARGMQLSLAVPAIAVDNGQNGYDFAALVAGGADVVHLMGYDFHYTGSSHLGPLAPLGWIDAVAARVQTLGLGAHFVLGIANYGVGSGWYVNSSDAIKQCGSGYATATTHMQSCSFGSYASGIAPHCTTPKGDLWFEDGASIGEKAQTARAHGLRGVAYYSLGGEAPGLFDALRAAYP